MIDFTGIKCPVCGVAFKEGDDVVVCPQCGAPYHRDCYNQEGRCIFTGLHEAGEEWKPPAPPKPPEAAVRVKDKECPVCGCLNDRDAAACARCGNDLRRPQQAVPPGPAQAPPPYNPYGAPQRGGYGVPPFVFDPMGGVNPADVLDTGVSFGDVSKLVRQNTTYYMPVFRYIKQTGKNKFNFSAFLFSGAWMLYRKQYKGGALVTGLMFLLYLLYLGASVFVATPALLLLMEEAGMDPTQGFAPSSAQMLIISQRMATEPGLYLQICLPMLCLLAMLVVMVVVGMRGNKMYLKHCVKTVRQVKAANVADEPTMTLDDKGGVNTSIAICMFVCYFLLVNVVPLLL
ncbi:RING finger protein [Acutalibacter caecimuris]|uniref:RING finger protein n=1 Tax=Acutalibacter caecimuris TaxID=3093657 RepID=UPI002AC915A7|nr:RING finger protein [Acutalibacter sp. M00118]